MMGTTIPYGYRIVDGEAVICEKEAARLKAYFRKYLASDAMSAAAKAAGLPFCAATYPRLFAKKEYSGTDYYPAIITQEYQEKLIAEWTKRRQEAIPGKPHLPKKEVRIYTNFRLSKRTLRPSEDAAEYAEQLYRRIRPVKSGRKQSRPLPANTPGSGQLNNARNRPQGVTVGGKATVQADYPGSCKRQGLTSDSGSNMKKRVAAYCRVSTDSEKQENSYDIQCRYYTSLIRSRDDWEMAGIYADSGISGTSTKFRTQFNRMIEDCEAAKIDLIITKSISRWARNTVDSLNHIRRLKDMGIPVYFEKESINTMDSKGEVLITIMSCLAQQESESISRNVRLGIQFHMQQGKRNFNANHLLGYGKDEATGKNIIVAEEADLIRRIFREYLEGRSPGMIAAHLAAEGIPTSSGKGQWNQSTVVSILRNEKYCGDFLMQKYYVKDFLTHKLAKNTGQLPQYLIENNHDPVVSKPIFEQVQDEMKRRSALKNEPSKIRYGSTLALHGRIFCGICGRKLKRYTGPDPTRTEWRCRNRSYQKRTTDLEVTPRCPCRNVREEEAKAAVIVAMNKLPGCREELLRLQQTLRAAQKDERLMERAEAANQGIQVRILLELIDIMENIQQREAPHQSANFINMDFSKKSRTPVVTSASSADASFDKSALKDTPVNSGACRDEAEFFERTRYLPGRGIIGPDGKIRIFSDEMVIRYLDRIIVTENGYRIRFKAGITVEVAK